MDESPAKKRRMFGSPVTVDEIATLDDEHLDDRVWGRVSQLVDGPAALAELDDATRAYYSTRNFEWEVGNGGLHQYFFNNADPEYLDATLAGYTYLGLDAQRRLIEEIVRPLAEREAAWRESLRDGEIETFFESYATSQLPEFDDRIGYHDDVRLRLVRDNPDVFAI